MSAARPLITLTTDFGLSDFYVPAMKAVLVRGCPDCRLIDITHQVPPQDVLCGAITLERAVDGFPPGTVHLAVIDPGVGTKRRILLAEVNRQYVICPDNGLITWAWRRHPEPRPRVYELTWRPKKLPSHTFHGRDIMAPAAALVASRASDGVLDELGRRISDPILLDLSPATPKAHCGRIIHIDHFGNATTNIPVETLRAVRPKSVTVNQLALGRLRRTYWDVPPGKPLALVGSSGLLEVAVRDGSAASQLQLKVGDEIRLS